MCWPSQLWYQEQQVMPSLGEGTVSIKESHAARLIGNQTQYRALSYRTVVLLRRETERYVKSLIRDVI